MKKIKQGLIKRIHVNQHNIKHNIKNPDDKKPPITVKTSRSNEKCWEVKIEGPSQLMYRPDAPLDCGARLWIQTKSEVLVWTRPS